MPISQRKRNVSHYFVFPLVFPLVSGWLLLLRLGGARTSGPRNLSRKESGLSSSSIRLLCAQSLRVTTRVTNLAAQERKDLSRLAVAHVRMCMCIFVWILNLDRAPLPLKEFLDGVSWGSRAATRCSSDEVSSHADWDLREQRMNIWAGNEKWVEITRFIPSWLTQIEFCCSWSVMC